MAIAQYSGIGITEMRNKLGGEVHSRNRSGQVTRIYVVPVNTVTAARVSMKADFATACALWSGITAEEVIQWGIFAARFTRRNSIAQSYKLNGRCQFISCNFNLVYSGNFPIAAPVFNVSCSPIIVGVAGTINPTAVYMKATFPGDSHLIPADHVMLIQSSPCVSAGINYPKNFFVKTDVLPSGTDVASVNLFTSYSTVYGAPVSGKKLFMRVALVNVVSGLKSKPWVISGVVT